MVESMVYPNEPLARTPEGVKPVKKVVNPSSKKIERIYRNIEDEPLINKIKALESKLLAAHPDSSNLDYTDAGKQMLSSLLSCFQRLIRVEYGPLGYLVKSDSESIIRLYGVDTDEDFYAMVEGSRIRISSPKLEQMVVAGGGRRFIGEYGLIANDPAETPANARLSDEAIEEIIESIKKRLR
ncbi:MAG: hypothetical protein LVQ95_03500 [Candidatus Micrarchaeales archaeon]|nr:hypothetical protein [Candidatus Micrarchaeales archaeon]